MTDPAWLKSMVFPGESGGDYGALFGYANRPGGAFEGVDLTKMTVNDVIKFTDPSGPYAQWVKGQLGYVATPTGGYQVVGSTLRDVVKGMGLTGNELYDTATQDAIGQYIYETQGPGAWEAWGKGGGGGGVVASTKGGAPVNGLLGVPPQQDASGLIGLLTGEQKPWASKLNDIGAVLLALSGSPAAQPLMEQLNKRKDAAREDARMNKTAQWLAGLGRDDLAQAVMAGSLSGSDAAAIAMTPADAEVVPAGFRELELQAEAAGLKPGTPEYQQFMLAGGAAAGGEGPAAFQALHMQALAAGFEEGSPEYKEFMATRGAGLVAESKAMGEAAGSAAAAAPAEVAAADETLRFIDEVRNHPGIDMGTGASSVLNVVPGTSGYDFQNRVNQLLSGGFLTAIDQLRGMGALSNAEGQTATRAISRMDTATSKEEFLAALADYERVVKEGRKRAAERIAAPADVAPATDGGAAGTVLQFDENGVLVQ